MTLEWHRLPDGSDLAAGTDWVYLVTSDDRNAVLTRWEPRPNEPGWEVARQAALHALQIRASVPSGPATVQRLRDMAQMYESGLDVLGQPAWRH